MKVFSIFGGFLGAVAMVVGASAQADLTYKDWTLNEIAEDKVLGVPVCHAFTNVANPESPIELSLTFPKDLAKAPFALVKIDPALNATQVSIKASSREIEFALPLNLVEDGVLVSYWYIPMNMDRLISRIAAANFLDISILTAGSEQPLKISLAGSSKILQEAKRCVGGSELFSKEFFKDLVDEDAKAYPVEGEITLERAFEFFQAAYVNHVGADLAQKELDLLRRENRNIIREEAAAQKVYDGAKTKLDQAQGALDQNVQERIEKENEIKANQAALKKLEPQKQAAISDLANKKAIYDPLREQAGQYTSRIESAESKISSAERNIRNLRSQMSTARTEIGELEREASNLESQIRGYESDLSSAERELSRAESDYRNYDENSEARRILDRDFRYRSAQNELQRTRQDLQNARQNVRQANQALRQAEQALQNCIARHGGTISNTDCVSEQMAVNQARNQLNQAEGQERQLEFQVQRLQNEIQRLESSAQDEARREKQNLANEVSRHRSQVDRYESAIRESRSRIRSIFDFEIPSRNQIISRAQNEIPAEERRLSSGRRELSAAQAEYADFKARTDYDRIREEYRQAQKTLAGIEKQIEDATSAISSAERRIVRLDRDKPSLVQNVERRKATADQALAKLTEVQSRMGEFKSKEAQLLQVLESALAQFDQARGLYKTIILEILN